LCYGTKFFGHPLQKCNSIIESTLPKTMKKIEIFSLSALFLAICMSLESCRVIGDIFKAGVWVGVLIVAGIIALVIFPDIAHWRTITSSQYPIKTNYT
jgi:hypothetical protein